MVADFPDNYVRQIERMIGELEKRAAEERETLRLLQAQGLDAADLERLISSREHHLRELRAELELLQRARGTGDGGQG